MTDIPDWLIGSVVTVGVGALLYIIGQLWKRWRERVVDDLDRALRRKVSLFERRYREFMLSSLRFIDVKGLATVGFYTLSAVNEAVVATAGLVVSATFRADRTGITTKEQLRGIRKTIPAFLARNR